tara:strand:- start:1633 stop:1899 length:267 start_codon:yes stop_codon:yes gene_type:complete
MSIQYKVVRYELNGNPPDEYIVGFYMENSDNGKMAYHDAKLPLESGVDKTQSEICNLAFSGAYDRITGISGDLASGPTVVGAQYIPNI